ncbi:hypothetical protein VCSRO22_3630 [Vibrio cholerae]|nr:hypothetical protein VCSRO22_3630 [Vibrio cholerae]
MRCQPLRRALCESPYFQIYGIFMQMSQLVIENIVSVLGGASVVVIGLSSWLGSLWSKRILNQEKLRMDKELQQLKDSNLANLKSMERELQSYKLSFKSEIITTKYQSLPMK